MTDLTPREVARDDEIADDFKLDRPRNDWQRGYVHGFKDGWHEWPRRNATPSSEATGRAEYVECGIDGCEFTVEAGEGRTMVLHKDDAHRASEATGSGEPPDFLDGARAEYRECLEVRRLLGYLWTATGRNSRLPVSDMFAPDDPLVDDIERLAIFPETEAK